MTKEDSIKVEYRAVSCVFQNIAPPTPLSTQRECLPPATKAGGTHSPGGEGGGGSIFCKTKDIGLASYSNNLSTVHDYGNFWWQVWEDYGEVFGKNDTVGAFLDITEDTVTITFTKNGQTQARSSS